MNPDLHAQFASLLDEHRQLVIKLARTYTRSPADQEDLAQEIVIQLWRAFPAYDPARRFSTWMYRIGLNVAISWVRTEAPRMQRSVSFDMAAHDSAAHEDDAARDEGQRLLKAFMDGCDALNRALLLLYLEEHSYAEMAEVLGISATNVATKINRLKERLLRFAEAQRGTG